MKQKIKMYGIVLTIPLSCFVYDREVKSYSDLLAGVGATVLGAFLSWLIIDEMDGTR